MVRKTPNFDTSIQVHCTFSRAASDVARDLGFTAQQQKEINSASYGSGVFVLLVNSGKGYGRFWYSPVHGFFFELPYRNVKNITVATRSLKEPIMMMIGMQTKVKRLKNLLVLTVAGKFPNAVLAANRTLLALRVELNNNFHLLYYPNDGDT